MRRGFIVPVVIMLFFAVPAFIVFAPVENVEAYLMQKVTPPKNEAMVQRWIQWLRESNFTQIEQGLDPSLRTDDLKDKLVTMARLIPAEQPRSVKPIGYLVAHHPDSSRSITTTLEYEFTDHWLLATVVEQEQSGTITV